ncbi:GPW/gp25 family protein [Cryptosporangium sp. NPDC048952]|uniref:GPW/gp25 family protein n=1 Tax=Cryptosporangium sp. NPDC048952 TaxID=3363961 RepID=UPI00371DB8F9
MPHLAFPFRLDGRGRSAEADDVAHARALIEQVLFVVPGERVNRPGFGSGLHQLVFEPAGGELLTAAEALIHGALVQQVADDVDIRSVEVAMDPDAESTLLVTVQFRPRRSGPVSTAVFSRTS